MNKAMIKSVFSKIKTDEHFQMETISLMMQKQSKNGQRQAGHTRINRLIMVTVSTCLVLAGVILVWQKATSNLISPTNNLVDSSITTINTTESQPTSSAHRVIVNPNEYPDHLASYRQPKQGAVVVSLEVRSALEDIKNADKYFFVHIAVIPEEQDTHALGDYIYNGKTISEWRILVDLSRGTYPYSEYNDDHGGKVTVEEWKQKQQEAKAASAQEHLDAALVKYNSEVVPIIKSAQTACDQSEYARLIQLGYDVSLMQTWSYINASEKQYHTILTGLLTRQQIIEISTNVKFGYFIEWVHDGDSIVKWEDSLK